MKTTHNLRNIFRAMIITAIFAILNIGSAQTSYLTAGPLFLNDHDMSSENVPEKSAVIVSNPAENTILDEMLDNPEYWVDYLRNTTDEEVEALTFTEDFTAPVLNQMESDPYYWVNYLENEKLSNEELNSTPTILDNMETDPYYWPHYLQSTVETDSI